MDHPVFYDASGRRHRWTLRALFAALVLLLLTAALFALTVIEVPVPRPLALAMERPHPRPLAQQVTRIGAALKSIKANIAAWLPGGGTAAELAINQITVGFYAPWDDASRASLTTHIGELDWLVPAVISVTGKSHHLTVTADRRLDDLLAIAPKRPELLPLVQNAINGKWDSIGIASLLHDAHARQTLLDDLEPQLLHRRVLGAVFDFEELPLSAQRDYLQFLREARQRFSAHHWLVTIAVPVGNEDWDLRAYAKVADRLFLMIYDEHSNDSTRGPIASQAWFVTRLKQALATVPRRQAIVAVGNYGYDWTKDGKGDSLSVEEAWLVAHDSEAPILFDRASGNPTFSYEEGGVTHTVWFLDAVSAWNELRAADLEGVAGVALWRLGTEDPDTWSAIRDFQSGVAPDMRALRSIGDVDVEGNGEILRLEDVPSVGQRSLVVDKLGLIVDEHYATLPTPYVVRRTGYRPGLIALTFDDGPDAEWTPKILDVLRAKHATATFFVIGENAMGSPLLLNRIIDQGNELGNHSFTHPNLAQVSDEGTRLELNSTQRLIEAYTGKSLRLFRAPYFGDAEPTTSDELEPALLAQQDGYTNVGLHVDPGDWRTPGVAEIVAATLSQVASASNERSANIVLLHDGGGERSQTVAALPLIIDGLRAKGYSLVPVSALAGLSRAQVMPQVTGTDLLTVRADVGVFLFIAAIGYTLKLMFFTAITLGIARALALAALAWRSDRTRTRQPPPAIDPTRFVSVLIPAFNEARVIEASVHRVLASQAVGIEVIVIDDGSTDTTSAVVSNAFANDPRVQLLTLTNGGKARALNRGLMIARGDVIIALDADTQFETDTIAKLARWFADPRIGAVAGNAKVGNRVNLVTRWQAVEYVTAQNLERRALALFDAIMVVPGAVGAWRRAALDAVGGYPQDTLAEDQDLTIAIQRQGWRVTFDIDAIAWTEAPERFRALATQRFRWAFGTLQCLWKHRSILKQRRPAGLAYIGIPQAWVFQIGFALISPLIDLALLISVVTTGLHVHQHGWAQTQSDVLRMSLYWVCFTTIDVLCGWIAYRLERRESRYPALLLVAQRFVYRQLMYMVVIRAVWSAMRGPWVGWGKLERSGRVGA